jgi:hypothetical protein
VAKRIVYTIADALEIETLDSGNVAVAIGSRDSVVLTPDEALEAASALLEGWTRLGAWEAPRRGIYPSRVAHALRRYLAVGEEAADGDQ